jgi:GNAT superfamily N-acetyltransferase
LLKFVCAYYRFDKIPFDRRSLSKGLDTLLRNLSQGQVWLMESHKKAVGYAVLTYNFDLEYGGVEGMLTDLYVEKRCRNKGIGSLALFEIEDFCRERGIRAIELQVLRHNRAAETFYRNAGFHVSPRKVMLLAVRPEEIAHPLRAIASKRR